MKQQMTRLLSFVSLVLVAATMQHASAQTPAAEERLLKAAFIYNFAKYTNWPEKVWDGQADSLKLCTAGNDELVAELMRLGGKRLKQRTLTILPLLDMQNQGDCHLLYIAASEKERYRDILASVSGESVLTVSELAGFGLTGGVIELFREKGRTRFIINLDSAREAGLEISSRLLILAVVIGSEETP